MEKRIETRTIVKTIEENVEMTVYETKDGMVFDNEKEALEHEDELEFLSYFNEKYKIKVIEPFEYGLNYGQTIYCHLVYIKKLSDETINDFIRFYELKDHPDDIIKLVTGWSFIAMISDVNLWIFDQTDRKFIVQKLEEVIEIKKNELIILNQLL